MEIDLKKIIKSVKVGSMKGNFGVRTKSKRDLGIISFVSLILVIVFAVYSFSLFAELEVSDNFFNDMPKDQQEGIFIDITELKEKLDLFKEKNGCFIEYDKDTFNISDPSL